MGAKTLCLFFVVLGGVAYHLALAKSGAESPWFMLTIAYGVAFAAMSALLIAMPSSSPPLRSEWIAGLAIGIAALAMELGYFGYYKAGGAVADGSSIASVGVAMVLLVYGAFGRGADAQHPPLTLPRVIGIAVALAAIYLVKRR